MKEIRIEDFITIKILELDIERFVYFVEDYNEKYFYMTDYNELCTHESIYIGYTCYDFYSQKARIIHRDNLDKLKKYVYDLHRQLTFSIPRAEKDTLYYIINDFKVSSFREKNDNIDNKFYENYNYFTSEEEATKYAKILHEELIKLRREEAMKKEK